MGDTRSGWLTRLDDLAFGAERGLVSAFLAAMTVMVFLDVVYRRLVDPETKLGNWIAHRFEVSDPASLQTLHGVVVPTVYALIVLTALWLCFRTAEREQERAMLGTPIWGALVLTLLAAALVVGLGWLMLNARSGVVYAVLFGAAAGGRLLPLLRTRPSGWVGNAGLTVVIGGALVTVALRVFPDGYTWSKELSLLLLLWVGFLGASICVHQGRHLRLEAAGKLLPEGLRRPIQALGFLAAGLFCAFMTLLGYRYVFDPLVGALAMGGVFEQTGIPDWLGTIVVVVAFGLATLRFAAAAISTLRGGSYGAMAPAEGLEEALEASGHDDHREAASDTAAPDTGEK